jgi:DNA-binding XRE family transcriptional regulator
MLNALQLKALRASKVSNRNRLAKAMDLAGVTQVTLADAIQTTQSRISKVKRGQYGSAGLPVGFCQRLAEFFGCTVDDIFPAERRKVA